MKIERVYTISELIDLRDAVHRTAVEHGWWEGFAKAPVPDHTPGCDSWNPGAPCDCPPKETRKGVLIFAAGVLDEKLFLVATELAEAFEIYRDGKGFDDVWTEGTAKPEGFSVEMADAYIRVLDLMGAKQLVPLDIDIVTDGREPMVGRLFMVPLKLLSNCCSTVSDRGLGEGLSTILAHIEGMSRELKFDLRSAVKQKMAYNETRPYRHGNKKA